MKYVNSLTLFVVSKINEFANELGGTLQFSILAHLWVHRKMNPSFIADELSVARSQISRKLTELEKVNLIIRSKEEGNHVSVILSSKAIDLWSEFLSLMKI